MSNEQIAVLESRVASLEAQVSTLTTQLTGTERELRTAQGLISQFTVLADRFAAIDSGAVIGAAMIQSAAINTLNIRQD